ncbi:MAG: glycosyltransferase [Erysipelotrichaceae bacterium]|nr:glycosyltransferase [Erysipelotrichaceae bacterium]MCB9499990.1 glycosyltransferase [Erysipelotrichaceae bacterium]
MNIAIFSDTFPPEINGVATSVFSLFTLLNKNKHNAYAVVPTDKKEVYVENNVIYIPGLEMKKLYGYKMPPMYSKNVYKILDALHIEICHVNADGVMGQFGFGYASSRNIPIVYTYHTMLEEYTYYVTKGYFDRFSKWAVRERCKNYMDRANEIISPSEKTKIYIRSIGVDKYVNIVPTGFDFRRFVKATKEKEKCLAIKKSLGIKDDEKVLLFLGRIAKEKSIDLLITGFKNYLDMYKDTKTKFVIVGWGPEEDELKELVNSYGIQKYVVFAGKIDIDKTQYCYGFADIFLNASISETQGLTFMEALATRAIVLCRFDNNLLGVIDNKVTGFFYVDEFDFKDKLHEILSMSTKELDTIRDNGFKSIGRFSEKTFYNNILEVYKRAIRRNW